MTESPPDVVPALQAAEESRRAPEGSPSLARSSAARFLADGAGVASSLLASIVTARALGPKGKGLFSSLTFMSAMAIHLFSAGLGDAAIFLVGRRTATLQRALSSTLAAGLALAVAGAGVLWLAGLVAFGDDWSEMRTAVLISCAGLPVFLCAYLFSYILSAQERIPATSAVLATMNSLTTAALWVFVGVLGLSIAGAALAGAVGAACGLVLAAVLLRRSRLSLAPQWDGSYVRSALRYGPTVAVSYMVSIMLQRADLLLVYALAGTGEAGHYSIGLTIASLISLLPIAISNATFPRIARLSTDEANALILRTCRLGVAAAIAGATVMTAATPVAVPLLFGRDFVPAVGPTLILVPSGVVWSAQWLLARAWAARGHPSLVMTSFGASLALMLGLDVLVIPSFGIIGAAAVSVVAPAVGLALCVRAYHRADTWTHSVAAFVPRLRDFRTALDEAMALVRSRTGTGTVDARP